MWTETEKYYAPIAQSTATIPMTDYEQFKKDAIELKKVQKELEEVKKSKDVFIDFTVTMLNTKHPVTSRYLGVLNAPTIEIGSKLDGVSELIKDKISTWWRGASIVYSKEDFNRDLKEASTPPKDIKGIEQLDKLQKYVKALPSWVKFFYPLK